ncbi:hypothetical protein [uncultured Thiodictyon sp.]|jgi:hypothetical protein|uniref:hypothetical protein n=1 Tax=uncultured Thiodictyon sp. TaxID=1846217 RepID=UPI0025E73550|nr:hypothetical protein [uncultured Thiodictyon sp.]
MSGEMYAQTRLAAAREAALRHQQTIAAQLGRGQTESARRAREYQAFKEQYGTDAARDMAAEFAACEAAHTRMREATAALDGLAQQARGLNLGRQDAEVTAFEGDLTRIEQAGREPSRVQREAADALDQGMATIRTDLQSRMDEAERERRVQADRRTRQRAQRETLAEQARIDPALMRVARRVAELLDASADPAQLEEADVAKLAQDIAAVRRDAWERDLCARRQGHIAELLRDALGEAGFTKKQDTWGQGDKAGEIHLLHELSGNELYVRVSTAIPEDQSIRLVMEGAAGSDREHLAPAPYCGDSLDAVIARAKALGLIIEGVHIKGPGPDGGWRALETADEAEQRRRKEKEEEEEDRRRVEVAAQLAAAGGRP